MSTIAGRVGGSKATLYKYFPSKESLFEAVLLQARNADFAQLDIKNADRSCDLRSLLTDFGRDYLRAILQPDICQFARIMHGEGIRIPHIASLFFAIGPNKIYSVLADHILAIAPRAGWSPTFDAKLISIQFLAMVRGDIYNRVIAGIADPPSEDEIRSLVAHGVDLIAPALEALLSGEETV